MDVTWYLIYNTCILSPNDMVFAPDFLTKFTYDLAADENIQLRYVMNDLHMWLVVICKALGHT